MTSSTARANAARRQPVSVAIATPIYGDLKLGYVRSLVATLDELPRQGIETGWATVEGNSLISLARNQLASLFMASNCTHMMSIDCDVEWSPGDILRLIQHDEAFVCGAYRKKNDVVAFDFHPLAGAVPCPRTVLIEIEAAGAGFQLIHRSVFERLADAGHAPLIRHGIGIYQGPTGNPPDLRDYYRTGVDPSGTYWSEDMAMAGHFRLTGGRIYLDPSIRLKHHGSFAYEGDAAAMFQAPPSVAAA